MDVAVAEVAEAAGDHPGKARSTCSAASTMKPRHVGDRDRNVVRQRLAFRALGFGDGVAHLPEGFGLCLARGDDARRRSALLQARRRGGVRARRRCPPRDRRWSPRRARASDGRRQAARACRGYAEARAASESSGTSSNPSTRLVRASRKRSSVERLGGLSIPAQATARAATAGTSRSAAAVTTPSVPSAPISSWSRL